MILQLDENYRIISDERNFILQRKSDPKKNPRKSKKAKAASDQWKNLGYWKDLSQLLASYSRQVLRTEIGTPPSKPYLVISEPSRKLSSGLGSSVWVYGGRIERGEIWNKRNHSPSLGFSPTVWIPWLSVLNSQFLCM